MKQETDVSCLSAFYYTGAVFLTGVFAGLSHSWGMAAGSSFLESCYLVTVEL